jgi:signal transduction histidine kinase/ligand-binding sensor domain-containing protein
MSSERDADWSAAVSPNRCSLGVALLLAFLLSTSSRAQTPEPPYSYSLQSWTETNGLPSNRIWDITQDDRGYLWLATSAGLVRFDGARFVQWLGQGEPELEGSISSVHRSRTGDLWLAFANAGLGRISNGTLTRFGEKEGVNLQDRVIAILEDHVGTMWFGGNHGVTRFRMGRWERFDISRGVPEGAVSSLYEDTNGTVWAGTARAYSCWQADLDIFEPCNVSIDQGAVRSDEERDFIEDGNRQLWTTDRRVGLRPVMGAGHTAGPFKPLMAASGSKLLRDQRNHLWLGTESQGLFQLSLSSRSQERVTAHITAQEGLTSDAVLSLFEDREGNLWVGTRNGLNRISATSITAVSESSLGIARSLVSARDGSVWLTAANGVSRFSGAERKDFAFGDRLPGSVVRAMHCDKNGTLWVATDAGLATFVQGRFVLVTMPPAPVLTSIDAITSTATGSLWLHDSNVGTFVWDGRSLEAVVAKGAQSLDSRGYVYTDDSGRIWIGARGGVVMYDGRSVREYSEKDGIGGGQVTAILHSRGGTLWLVNYSGLHRFNRDRFERITTRNGLPSNRLFSILEDENGDLWLGTSVGIVHVTSAEIEKALTDPGHHIQYRLFDRSDGLRGAPIALGHPTAARGNDGTLWFVTDSGVAVVDPKRLQETPTSTPTILEDVVVDGRGIGTMTTSPLPASPRRVEFQFTAFNLRSSSKVRFRYWLEGFDTTWVDAGSRRSAVYTNLEAGEYRFRVMASDNGVWNSDDTLWSFRIQPVYYQTRAFYAACIAAAGLIIAGTWWQHVHRVRRRMLLVVAERSRIARELHDTLLQSLVGCLLQFESISKMLDTSPPSARQQLNLARDQVEQGIGEIRRSIWGLRSPGLDQGDLATAVRSVADRTAKSSKIAVDVVIDGDPEACSPDIKQQLLRIVQEALTNATRHSHATRIRAELRSDSHELRIRVSDNGRGFDQKHIASKLADGQADRWGLVTMHERARSIGARLEISSQPGLGTVVDIWAPLTARSTHE